MTAWANPIVQWPLGASLAAIAAVSAFVSCMAVFLVRRVWPPPAFKENNEMVGFTYAVYGLIYGVMLAFVIVVGWQRFTETEQLVMHEATLLSELWHDSVAFPPAVRDGVQMDLIAYAQSVVDDEWPTMAAHGRAHPQTEEIYERLWALTYRIQPETKNQEAYLNQFLARMNELSGARRLRILHSKMGVHRALLLVLLVGAVPTVAYTLLFSNKHAWVEVAIMGSIMLIVMSGLLLALSLLHPFSGEDRIKPYAFEQLLDSFHKRQTEAPSGSGPVP